MTGSPRRATGKALVEACDEGNHRAVLFAMRAELARAMATAPPNVIAQIAGRLQAVEREIAALPPSEKVSVVDDLAARRSARRADAADRASTGRDGH